jgi:hypothetical protein
MNLDIVLRSDTEAANSYEAIKLAYGIWRASATDTPGKYFCVTVTAITKSIQERFIWLYYSLLAALGPGGIASQLLSWIWAIFGALFGGRICIVQPTDKYEKSFLEPGIKAHVRKFLKRCKRDQFCLSTLLRLASTGGADGEVYADLANVFKCVGIEDESSPLCECDFSRLCLHWAEAKNRDIVEALIAAIIVDEIKMSCYALMDNPDGKIRVWIGGTGKFGSDDLEKARFCIDTIGGTPPEEIFDGEYVKVCAHRFGKTCKLVCGYAGKSKYGKEILFYTTKECETT